MWWYLIVAFLGLALYRMQNMLNYWTRLGVEQLTLAEWFIYHFANFKDRLNFTEIIVKFYQWPKSPDARYFGMYNFLAPVLLAKHPDFVKTVAVKEFDHFTDHRNIFDDKTNPLWSRNLFVLKGQQWKDMRSTLSPSFTSSKMRAMFVLMAENAEQFVNYFLQQKGAVVAVEAKDAFSRFTNDVIASTAFGVQVDSLKNRDNEFYMMGKDLTDLSGFKKKTVLALMFIFPRLFQLLNVSFFPKRVERFFCGLVRETISYRQKHNVVRPDMINLLMEAMQSGEAAEEGRDEGDAGFAVVDDGGGAAPAEVRSQRALRITEDEICANAFLFFFAGFESVSNLLCFMAHELALNPDVQRRLADEVEAVRAAAGGRLTYEALTRMKYLDMVVSETLRKWPVAIAVDRVCTKPFTIAPERAHERPATLEVGTPLIIPVYALHRDPQFFPEPERFDPERFSDENKHKIQPFTYLPFGIGPRSCIASRFALLETKALFFHLISNFEVVPVEKTPIPIKLKKLAFNLTPEGGCWLGFKRRAS